MKKCPKCQRTFEDSMRFCQSDGTPLVDDTPLDPYKTMVASQDEISAALGSVGSAPSDTESSMKVDEEVLQLPEDDPRKTMYASEEEIRKEMEAHDDQVVDLPPLAPEPPKFSEPSLNAPSFGDVTPSAPPPPSPFNASANDPIANPSQDPPFSKTTPPIPSPFDNPKPSTYQSPSEYTPAEPELRAADSPSPFDPAPSAPLEPAASAPSSQSSWNAPEPMQNAPMSAAGAGQNKTLAIVSLVAGILGLTLCCGTLLPSILGIVLGFMAKGKATNDPANFGGRGLALGGIITGAIGLIASIAYLVFVFFLGGMQMIMQGT